MQQLILHYLTPRWDLTSSNQIFPNSTCIIFCHSLWANFLLSYNVSEKLLITKHWQREKMSCSLCYWFRTCLQNVGCVFLKEALLEPKPHSNVLTPTETWLTFTTDHFNWRALIYLWRQCPSYSLYSPEPSWCCVQWTGSRWLLIRKCFVSEDSRVLSSDNSHLVDTKTLRHVSDFGWADSLCIRSCQERKNKQVNQQSWKKKIQLEMRQSLTDMPCLLK